MVLLIIALSCTLGQLLETFTDGNWGGGGGGEGGGLGEGGSLWEEMSFPFHIQKCRIIYFILTDELRSQHLSLNHQIPALQEVIIHTVK